MANALVIVESPAKAKKIQEYLGAEFTVESSIGHIRDLPRNAADVPKAYKGEPWARTGIDVDNGFKPLYVENRDKKDHIRLLKTLLKEADELYLATDEDREGEAIAWHLIEVLNPGPEMPVKRMVFHEITKDAIQLAVQSPRELDRKMVDAQEARRILDRLYGYEVSPVLWKKVMPQLSAGRVQSVATRIVVERERERMAFIEASYWDVKGTFAAAQGDDQREFSAALNTIDGVRLASGRDFGDDGRLARDDVTVLDEAGAQALVGALDGVPYEVRARETKPYRRRPAAPFITSTYQQEAGRKLGMSAQMAMRAAQGLYEKGYITYMRTDSTTLSDTALQAARSMISERYGKDFLPDAPRHYATKSKNAQEAHEAIRPAGDTFRPPAEVAQEVPQSEARAYELIWQRVVASQMTDCTGETVTLKLGATAHDGRDVEFAASGTVIAHMGFREVYEETKVQDRDSEDDADERRLPRSWREMLPALPARSSSRAHHVSSESLHGGVTRQAPRGTRRGASVDLRIDHRHHPRPWLCLEEGFGARAVVHRLLGGQRHGGPFPQPCRLRLHRQDGGRPRQDRHRYRGGRAVAQPLLFR